MTTIEEWNNLLQSAENGDTQAQLEVAFTFENGLKIDGDEVVPVDLQRAFLWIKRAFESGDKEAKMKYAHYLTDRKNPLGVLDIELGIKLYEEEMEAGNEYATYCLGLEERNKGNFEKAFQLYEEALKNEDFYKDFTVAMCLYYGIGTSKDKLKAFNIFKLIATKEDVAQYEWEEANYMLGKIYLEGEVVEKDIDKARFHLELADEDEDHRSAQEILLIIGRRYKD